MTTVPLLGIQTASAQQPAIPTIGALVERLADMQIPGFVGIDVVAMAFAVLAALLSLRAFSALGAMRTEDRGVVEMRSPDPQTRPGRTTPQQLIERIRCERPDPESLFVSGVKLLTATDEPRRLVGIAALEAVALGGNETLAIAAMEHLADHMQQRFSHNHDGEECRATADALCKGGMVGRYCDRKLTFAADHGEEPDTDTSPRQGTVEPRWRLVGGVTLSRYYGGRIEGQIVSNGNGTHNGVWCNAVKLVDCTIVDDSFGASCLLTRCRVLRYNPERPFINGFVYCDFSGCHISQAGFLADLRDHGCWYDPTDPPQGDLPVKWTAFLHQGDPGVQSSWKILLDNNLATRH